LLPPLIEATRALRVGDGLDQSNDVGPVISERARERIAGWIDRTRRVLVDGRDGVPPQGCFIAPTIVEVDRDDPIVAEEVFGPLLAVVHAHSLDEAIDIVNSSRFGNGTSIFTESGASVRRYRHEVQAGMVGVNIGVAAPVAFFPFSGWKDSFLGDLHAHGTDAVDFYTRKKTVTSRYFSTGQGTGSYFVER
jgi:malonate-semialdehyde dehydrogenase (acetylating)/methylmalonate-semialdehyde dehydrogenase